MAPRLGSAARTPGSPTGLPQRFSRGVALGRARWLTTACNISAAALRLAAGRLCNSIYHAQHLISCGIEDGTLPTRYRLDDGVTVPIGPSEWSRKEGEFHVGVGRLE